MKVLLARPKIEKGGASKTILQLAKGMAKQGIEVNIASNGGEWLHTLEDYATIWRVPLYPTSIPNLVKSSAILSKIVRNHKIDIVNTHHRFAGLSTKWLSKIQCVPHISTVHEIKMDKPVLSKFALGDFSIVFSQAVKHHLTYNYQIPSDRVLVVPIGIEHNIPVDQTVAANIMEFGLSIDVPIITTIARFSPEKGCRYYLEAAALVNKLGREIQFLLVGDGPERAKLERLSTELNLGSSMKILSWQEDVSWVISISNFLVLPSLSEGFGLVILEGYSQFKPTIASNVDGIKELIIDNETGILVSPGNPKELANAIIKLVDDGDLSQQFGTQGYRLFTERYKPEKMVDKTLTLFSSILEN